MMEELRERLQEPEATFTASEVQEMLEAKRNQQVQEAAVAAHKVLQMIREDGHLKVRHEQAY